MSYYGKKGTGSLESPCNSPRTPLEGHDLSFQKYSSVYMSSCSSTPNPNLVSSIFPGLQNIEQRGQTYFCIKKSNNFFFLVCGHISLYSEAPRES